MELFQNKKETITLCFDFEGNEVRIESKRNKYMKEIIEQYLKIMKKDM